MVASIPKLPRETPSQRLWVGFLAPRFIRGNLILFEIPNKSFVLYTFISKNRHEQDSKEIFLFSIFFPSCFAVLQSCVCFQYSIFLDCAILRKCLHKTLSVAAEKLRYIHQRRAWISLVSERESTLVYCYYLYWIVRR